MKINNDLTPPLFKIRASGLGKLMTEPKTKVDKEAGNLSATAKSFLIEWYTEQLYGRRKPLENKFLAKGNACEDEAIAYLNKLNGTDWKNNKEQFSNDYMTGEPDVISDHIVDIKNSWSCFTHPLFTKEAKKDYQWQVLGYMWMLGKRKGEVVHTLMNTPPELIPFGENINDHIYHGLPDHLRIKRFTVPYSEEKIEQIKMKVIKAREFLSAIAI